MAVIEVIESRVYSLESGGRRMGVQVFLVKMTPQAAIAALGIVVDSSTYPDDSELVARRITPEIIPDSPGFSRITVSYDNFPGSIGAPVNPSDPFFRSWSFDFQHRPEMVLRAEKKTLTYAGPSGEVNRTVWEPNTDLEPIHTFTILTRRTVLTTLNASTINLFASLSNTMQKIGDRWYRMTIGMGEEIEPGRWSVEYNFENDPGTPDIFVEASGPMWNPVAIQGEYSTGMFARPPFYYLELHPGQNPNDPPVFWARRKYDDPDPQAWESLPGMN